MSPSDKPRGYMEFLLVIDVETSGMAYNVDDPSCDPSTGKCYQIVSIGLIVANAQTFEPIEELYLEIQHDPKYAWEDKAQRVHGLSREYLKANGVSSEDAVVEICNMIIKYWGSENTIHTLGHNVVTFDLWFLKRLLREHGLELKFGSRHVDTSSVGFVALTVYNSDDLFYMTGLPKRDPAKHNALDDARYALASMKMVRQVVNAALGE